MSLEGFPHDSRQQSELKVDLFIAHLNLKLVSAHLLLPTAMPLFARHSSMLCQVSIFSLLSFRTHFSEVKCVIRQRKIRLEIQESLSTGGASQENNEKIVMQWFLWTCDGRIPLEPEWRHLSIKLLNAPVCSGSSICVALVEKKGFMSQ